VIGGSSRIVSNLVQVRVSRICKHFGGVVALDNASFELFAPGIFGFVGENGSGKTTLFDIVCGLVRPDSGSVLVNKHDITTWSATRRGKFGLGFGRSFQHPRLFASMTALENVLVGYPFSKGTSWDEAILGRVKYGEQLSSARDVARQQLDLLGLGDNERSYPAEMSFGQRKRLEIARVLLEQPRFVWLDEPFSGVEQGLVTRLAELLTHFSESASSGVCIIDHRMEVVRDISTRLFQLHNGKIVELAQS